MNRRLGTCLLSLVAVTVVWSALAAGAATAGATATDVPAAQDGPDATDGLAETTPGPSPDVSQPLTTPEGFDATVFRIRLYENRSAKWTIQHSRPLNRSEVDQFEAFAADFRANESATFENFRLRAQRLVAFGQNATERSMTATGFARDAGVVTRVQTRGVLEMSFTWHNFSEAVGERLAVGDVFEGGMFVGDGQRLEFHPGPELAFVSVDPPVDSMAEQNNLTASESVTWIGERQFTDRHPQVTLGARAAIGGSAGGEGSTGGDEIGGDETGEASTGGDPTGSDFLGVLPIVLIGAIIVVAAAGTLAWQRGYLPPGEGEAAAAPAGTESQAGAEDGSGTEAQVAGGGGAAAAQVTEEELLSDEDRVMQLLDENSGRMKQVAIVEETDWSKSKVSMLLSDMEEEGQISKLRLGRENIISVAGQEPDAAGSPFEDE